MHKMIIKYSHKSLLQDFTEMFHFSLQTPMLNVTQKKHVKGMINIIWNIQKEV